MIYYPWQFHSPFESASFHTVDQSGSRAGVRAELYLAMQTLRSEQLELRGPHSISVSCLLSTYGEPGLS